MKKTKKQQIKNICNVGFVLYIMVIFYFVLFSERYGRQIGYIDYQYNLKPFQEIHRFIVYRDCLTLESWVTNLLGNIFAFSPFGVLLPIVRNRKTRFFGVLIYTFFLSLSIESLQLIFKIGVFDVDDLMLNTLGGIIGYVCYLIVRRIYHVSQKGL